MTLFIAEIGANHLGSLDRAVKLVQSAAAAGADAVKFQAYAPGLMCLDKTYRLDDGPWEGRLLTDLYHEAYTPFTWFDHLFGVARACGIVPFASVFDEPSLKMLETLGCPTYKISSFELVDLPFLAKVAATGKNMIMSTGMAAAPEIAAAVETVRRAGCEGLTLLTCVSAYPTNVDDARLGNLEMMRHGWKCHAGLSDHSLGHGLAVAATRMGADVIERHFTLKRSDGGPDAGFSLEYEEFRDMVIACESPSDGILTPLSPAVERAMRIEGFGPTESEASSLKLRRSLYFTKSMAKGAKIKDGDIATARPAMGLPPSEMDSCWGKTVKKAALRGQPVTRDVL